MIDCGKHTLNVITKNLPVALSTALAETLHNDATVSDKFSKWKYSKKHTFPPFPRPDML